MIRHMSDTLVGASRHLQSVFVAILLTPVLPDVAVDLFGDAAKPERDALLRFGAVAVVVGVCVAVYAIQATRARRDLARRARAPLGALDRADLLIAAISLRRGGHLPYERVSRRSRAMEVVEFLVHSVRPQTVLGVVSPDVDKEVVDQLSNEFAADGITFVPVHITDAYEPAVVIREAASVMTAARELKIEGTHILVDVTSGTVAMSLAMMRVANGLGARCASVSSRFRNGVRVPGEVSGHQFDPRLVIEPS